MKNILIFLFALSTMLSCSSGLLDENTDENIIANGGSSSDDNGNNNNSSGTVINTVAIEGKWSIALFIDRKDITANYVSSKITFNANKTLVFSHNGVAYSGSWVVKSDSGKVKLYIDISSNVDYVKDLSDDWVIDLSTSTNLNLSNVSGGDGHVSVLKLKK